MSRPWTLRLSVLALAAACLVIGYVVGRPGQSAPPSTYLAQLTTVLELRPAQVAAIAEILAEEDRAVDEMLAAQLDALREPVAERRARTEEALLAQLDADQRDQYRQLAQATSEQR
ncbi:MAG: hypothetical protein ACYTCU_02000 [Planctomycetota bacterium]|jgi:hypothetical protein